MIEEMVAEIIIQSRATGGLRKLRDWYWIYSLFDYSHNRLHH
jgi:hypothetical protein